MQITKFAVVALLLVARTCRTEIVVGTSNPDETTSRLIEDLVNIVTSCYGDRTQGIGLAGNLSDALLRTLSAGHLIPVALIDNTVKFTDRLLPVPVKLRRKLNLFVVDVISGQQLDVIVQKNIKYSVWWNHMASFFILDRSPGCVNVIPYLFLAWNANLLNAKVICYRFKNERRVVSFNPFASRAPVSWRRGLTFRGPNKHVTTLFEREYRGNESICVDLDFDKTKDLGGYVIRVEGPPLGDGKTVPETRLVNTYQFWSTQERILDTVCRSLNATPKFTGLQRWYKRLDQDMKKLPFWMMYRWDTDLLTYPHEQNGVVLISRFRGHKSQLNKILSVIDVQSRFGLGLVYLVTLIFLKLFVRQALVPALLNLIRITCNTGFTNLPGEAAPRLYLSGLLFFVVTMQGIFQGNLASLLTKQIPLRNVDTLNDLVDFGYKIYGYHTVKALIDHPGLKERYVGVDNPDDCIAHVVHDESAACAWFAQGDALDLARKFNLHVSSDFVAPIYIGFEIRWYWPLEQQFNIIVAKMVEADTLQPWDVKCNPMKLSDFQFDEEVKKNKDFKNIELGELTFAFVILGIGLVCATVTFIVELAIHRYKTRIVNVRVRIPN